MKNLLTFSLLLFVVGLSAQTMQLTLSDAILKRGSTFAPDRLANLQWIPETTQFSYLSADRQAIMIDKGEQAHAAITLEQLNKACQTDLKQMPGVRWVNSNRFYFHYDTAYIAYDLDKNQGFLLTPHARGAVNADFLYKYNQLAYTIDNDLYTATIGIPKTTVVDNTDRNIVSGQAIARYEFGIGKGTFWSPDGAHLAFYEKDETNVADYPLLDINTTPGSLTTTKYPMAGQKSEKAKIGIYNRMSKQTVYLKTTGEEDQYLTNLGWGPNNEFVYVAVVNRDQNRMWLNQYNAKTGDFVKTLFEEKHSKYVEPENPVWFLPNNSNEFLWMSERDGFMHVYRYDKNGTLLNQVTKGNWVTLEIIGLDNTGKKLLVKGTDENGLNQYAYSVNLDGSEQKQIAGKPGVHSFSLNDKSDQLIDAYSSLEEPYKINVIDLNGKILRTISVSKNKMEGYAQTTTEILEIKSPGGMMMNARMIKPSHFSADKKYPVVVYVYGGPHAQMVTNRYGAGAPLWMHYLAEKGYLVFTVDNRGSANRGFDFENTIHRRLGTPEMEDQLAGVEYLKSLPYADTDRMAVHGWSYGGFMTTSLMLRHPGIFKAGVAGGPVTDWKYYEAMYGERYMDRPEENEEGYKTNRLMNYVQNLEGELLLIHGTVDDVVVMQHNLALVKAFVDAGVQMDFFPYPMHPHNVRGKDRVHLMEKVIRYMERAIGPGTVD